VDQSKRLDPLVPKRGPFDPTNNQAESIRGAGRGQTGARLWVLTARSRCRVDTCIDARTPNVVILSRPSVKEIVSDLSDEMIRAIVAMEIVVA
jgi:hypothetical protein